MKGKKIKKAVAVVLSVCTMSALLAGCANKGETEEQLVTLKEEQEGNQNASASGEKTGAGGSLQELVQAPEKYEATFSAEGISVTVDAPVILPEAEGFKNYKVTSRAFTQEDYDRVNSALLGGASLYDRDMEAMGPNGFTKEEIKAKIESLQEKKEINGEAFPEEDPQKASEERLIDFDGEIAKWEALLDTAPDEITYKDIPAVVSYSENTEDEEKNYLNGYAKKDGREYDVFLDNNLRDDWRWISFRIYEGGNGGYMPWGYGDEKENPLIDREAFKKEAGQLVSEMGMTEFAVNGEEYFKKYSYDELDDTETQEIGYGFHFTRMVDGIPVTYTHEPGTAVEGNESAWPYERLDFIYGEGRLNSFEWENPYQLEKLSDEYVFLLPFSEIQGIFEKMLVKKYGDFFDGMDISVDFNIDEVRLGYARVMEKGNPMEGQLVPVWDFFGSQTIHYPDNSEPCITQGPYESWLTILAADGTVMDRGLGY